MEQIGGMRIIVPVMSSPAATSTTPADLTMVVPTYNERARIEELVRAVFAACEAHNVALELIVVDDNSPDGTGTIADALIQSFRMHVIHRPGKLGLGTAVVAGFESASARVVGVMDADFSHPPALVPRLLAAMHATGADVVVASRYVSGGSTPNWPMWRRLLSRAACIAARPLTPVRDPASGFFLIRHSVASRVAIRARGFKICLELLMRGWPEHLVEIPYRFDDREQGESKMSLKEAAGYLVQLRDLYALRIREAVRVDGRKPRRQYRRLRLDEVETMLAAGAYEETRLGSAGLRESQP
jgi:dolichol-phosphate mannosyltransferase